MIDFTIKTLESTNHDFSVEDETTVAQLKERIRDEMGIEIGMQRLIFCGRVLTDEHRLSEFDVNGKVIHLVPRPPPSPRSRNYARRTQRNQPPRNQQNASRGQRGFRDVLAEVERVMDMMTPPGVSPTPQRRLPALDPPSQLVLEQRQALRLSPATNRLQFVRQVLNELRTTLSLLSTLTENINSAEAASPPAEPMEVEVSLSSESPVPCPHGTSATETAATETAATGLAATETTASETAATETTASEIVATGSPQSETAATNSPASEIAATESPASESQASEMLVTETLASGTAASETAATETPTAETPAIETTTSENDRCVRCDAAINVSDAFRLPPMLSPLTQTPPSEMSSHRENGESDGSPVSSISVSPSPRFRTEPREAPNVLSRPCDLAQLVEELDRLQAMFSPYRRNYLNILRESTSTTLSMVERLHRQNIVELVCDAMHSFSHAYHAISDIGVNVGGRYPRLTAGFASVRRPLQAQINAAQNARRTNRAAATTHAYRGGAGSSSPSAPSTPTRHRNQQIINALRTQQSPPSGATASGIGNYGPVRRRASSAGANEENANRAADAALLAALDVYGYARPGGPQWASELISQIEAGEDHPFRIPPSQNQSDDQSQDESRPAPQEQDEEESRPNENPRAIMDIEDMLRELSQELPGVEVVMEIHPLGTPPGNSSDSNTQHGSGFGTALVNANSPYGPGAGIGGIGHVDRRLAPEPRPGTRSSGGFSSSGSPMSGFGLPSLSGFGIVTSPGGGSNSGTRAGTGAGARRRGDHRAGTGTGTGAGAGAAGTGHDYVRVDGGTIMPELAGIGIAVPAGGTGLTTNLFAVTGGVGAYGPNILTRQPDGGVFISPVMGPNNGTGDMTGSELMQNVFSSLWRSGQEDPSPIRASTGGFPGRTATTTTGSRTTTTRTNVTSTTTAPTNTTAAVTNASRTTAVTTTATRTTAVATNTARTTTAAPNITRTTTAAPNIARTTTAAPNITRTTTAAANASRTTTAATIATRTTTAATNTIRTMTATANATRTTTAPTNTTQASAVRVNVSASANAARRAPRSTTMLFGPTRAATRTARQSSARNAPQSSSPGSSSGRTSDDSWGLGLGAFPGTIHIELPSMESPFGDISRMSPETQLRAMQSRVRRRQRITDLMAERARVRSTTSRAHQLAVASMVYDNFLHCDSVHARHHLDDRRDMYQDLYAAQTRLIGSRPRAIDIEELEGRNYHFTVRHMAVMMRLLSGPTTMAAFFNAFLITVARVQYMEPRGEPQLYDPCYLPQEFVAVRNQLRPIARQLLEGVTSINVDFPFDGAAGAVVLACRSFLNRMGTLTPIDPLIDPMQMLRCWLRSNMPSILGLIISSSTTALFIRRFYTGISQFYMGLCTLVMEFCVNGFEGLTILHSAFINEFSRDFESSARDWISLLARENLFAIETSIAPPQSPVNFYDYRYDGTPRPRTCCLYAAGMTQEHFMYVHGRMMPVPHICEYHQRRTMPLTAPPLMPPPPRNQTPDTIESLPSMSIPSMCSSSDESGSAQTVDDDREREESLGNGSPVPEEDENAGSGADTASTTSHNTNPRSPVETRSAATSPRRDSPPTPTQENVQKETEEEKGDKKQKGQDDQDGDNEQLGQAQSMSPAHERSQTSSSRSSPESLRFVPPVMQILENWGEEWAPVFNRDQRTLRERVRPQEPLSDAYLSGMSSRKRRCVRASRPAATLTGIFNESTRDVTERPVPLDTPQFRNALCDSVRTMVRARVEASDDFDPVRFSSTARFIEPEKTNNKKESETKTEKID